MTNEDSSFRLSYGLAKAVAGGRTSRARPNSREQVLARLLTKRAAAYRAGLADLEAALRLQITWSLPVRRGENGASPTDGEAALDHRL